jgi:hypothetical protein
MIYETVSKSHFIDAFRSIRPDNFSYEGLTALYEYFDELSEDQDMELDVIAICCSYREFDNVDQFLSEGYTSSIINSIDDIEELTTVIRIDDTRFICAEILIMLGYQINISELFDNPSSSEPTRIKMTAENEEYWFIKYYRYNADKNQLLEKFKQYIISEEKKLI